jgi:hypothetical protein
MTHLSRYPFLKDCTDMELVALAHEAIKVGDTEFRKFVLIELGVRAKVTPSSS